MLVKSQFLFSSHHPMVLIFVSSLVKISQRISELLSGHDFPTEIFKGA